MRQALASVLITAFVLTLGCIRRGGTDWSEVERPLMRLESGLRHEPIISVRSKIADLDAALNWYVKSDPDREKESRVQAVRQAIQHLEHALETPQDVQISESAWPRYGLEIVGAQFISRQCSPETGTLYVNGADVPVAHLKQARQLLAEARGTVSAQGRVPYDPTKDREGCAQAAETEAARKKREAAAWRAAHPLFIEFRALKTCSISVETEDRVSKGYVQQGQALVANAREAASVYVWDSECWDISVNGSRFRPKFAKAPGNSEYQYETVIRLKDLSR